MFLRFNSSLSLLRASFSFKVKLILVYWSRIVFNWWALYIYDSSSCCSSSFTFFLSYSINWTELSPIDLSSSYLALSFLIEWFLLPMIVLISSYCIWCLFITEFKRLISNWCFSWILYYLIFSFSLIYFIISCCCSRSYLTFSSLWTHEAFSFIIDSHSDWAFS